jgi:two-component system, sensor histidine kinase PdtaS
MSLKEQLKQKNAQLAAVRDISRAIAEARNLDETLDLITRRTTEIMHVESCSIYLYNKTGDQLILAATTGLKKEGIGKISLPRGEGLTGWAAEHRQSVATDNAFKDPRSYRVIGSGESKFTSLMASPLVSHNKVIGGINVQTQKVHEFTEEETELFGIITELAALALEKAQLVHTATIQEMHHRVKNNLQTIAMLLRLQMEQEKQVSPSNVLNETINRVLSIATVHEMLSEAGVDKVGTLDLIRRVALTISSNMTDPKADIRVTVDGDNVELSSQRATSLALVANELLQNALEHGMAERKEGQISIKLANTGRDSKLSVSDNGNGLPPDFDPDLDLNLGLDIVRTTITEDMQGQFFIGLADPPPGTVVKIKIPLKVITPT